MAKRSISPKLTSRDVLQALYHYYRIDSDIDDFGAEWAALEEFSFQHLRSNRRADLYLVRAWGGKPLGHERILIEVKVSRADLLKELKDPSKLQAIGSTAHRIFFATPTGLIKETDTLPDGVGIIEVSDRKIASLKKRARKNASPLPIPESAFVEAFRRASRSQMKKRQIHRTYNDPHEELIELKAELKRVKASLEQQKIRSKAKQSEIKRFISYFNSLDGFQCKCGEPLVYDKYLGFSHTNKQYLCKPMEFTQRRLHAEVDVEHFFKTFAKDQDNK